MEKYNKLSREEDLVLNHKATEPPFSGRYDRFDQVGVYLCRKCNSPLYLSSDKFASHCGWPSFDDEISGAVERHPDADGQRTEIVCRNCGGHLGHVFTGEGATSKGIRHCVNSLSLSFEPAFSADGSERIIFAGGCFWGVQHRLKKAFGVVRTRAGYIGGHTVDPTYEQVCSKASGHAEAVEVLFDPKKISFEGLVHYFFSIHDPTQRNRQGPDIGDQYRSAVFYYTQQQKLILERVIRSLHKNGVNAVTEIQPATIFHPAEEYHQNYIITSY